MTTLNANYRVINQNDNRLIQSSEISRIDIQNTRFHRDFHYLFQFTLKNDSNWNVEINWQLELRTRRSLSDTTKNYCKTSCWTWRTRMSLSSKPDGQGQYAPILDINEKILVFSRKKYTNRDGTRPPANNKNLVMGQKPRSFFVDWTKTRVKKVCDCATTEKDDKQSSTNFHLDCAQST